MTKAVNMEKIFFIAWPEHQVHHPWWLIPGASRMEGAGYSWGCVRWLQSYLLPPASTTEELKSILSIDFLHANLISHQQKDHLETFLKREALMLCLSKMLQTPWECWADCAGGVFVSQVSKTVLPHCPLFCWYRLLTLPTTCSVCSWFCYSNLPDSFVSGHGGEYFLNTCASQSRLDSPFACLPLQHWRLGTGAACVGSGPALLCKVWMRGNGPPHPSWGWCSVFGQAVLLTDTTT